MKNEYKIWKKKGAFRLSEIKNTHSNNLNLNRIDIMQDGDSVGGLCSELYFAWNCYNDSFYYILLPLLDIKETWLSDSISESPYVEFLYQKYFDLLEVHKRKFNATLKSLNHPCLSRKMIMELYEKANSDFYNESLKMLKECWGSDGKPYLLWGNKIDEMLENYKE